MLHERFIKRVATLGGLVHDEEAEPIVVAALSTLRTTLPDAAAELAARELPAALAAPLRSVAFEREQTFAELRERHARARGVPLGFAMEQLEVVCRVLGEGLGDAAARAVSASLPPELQVELMRRAEEPVPLPPPRPEVLAEPPASPRRTLSSGRPRSSHPLSEAPPPPGHTHSVAVSPEPHADTKLSSAHGLTQERLAEDLADAKPRASRSLANG